MTDRMYKLQNKTNSKEVDVADGKTVENELENMFIVLGFERENELFDKIIRQYDLVKQKCSPEGPVNHWLACCLYTTSWISTAIGTKPVLPFSTIVLLDHVQLSIMEFIDRLEICSVMVDSSKKFLQHIETLRSKLSISIIVFQKFLNIFREVSVENSKFKLMGEDCNNQKQNISSERFFSYIWTIYLFFKKQIFKPYQTEDYSGCYHLLLVIIDYVISYAIDDNGGSQIINPKFLSKIEDSGKTVLEYLSKKYNLFIPKIVRIKGIIKPRPLFKGKYLDLSLVEEAFNYYTYVVMNYIEIDERIFFMRITPELIFDSNVDFAVTVGLRPIPDGTLSKDAAMLMKKRTDSWIQKIRISLTNFDLSAIESKYLTVTDLTYPMNSDEEKDRVAQLQQLLNVDPKTTEEFLALLNKFPPYLSESLAEKVNSTPRMFNPEFDTDFVELFEKNKKQMNDLFRRFLHRLTLLEMRNSHRLLNIEQTLLSADDDIKQKSDSTYTSVFAQSLGWAITFCFGIFCVLTNWHTVLGIVAAVVIFGLLAIVHISVTQKIASEENRKIAKKHKELLLFIKNVRS